MAWIGAVLLLAGRVEAQPADRSGGAAGPGATIAQRFAPPSGFQRLPVDAGSFGSYLRHLPLKQEGAPVLLHDGRLKARQDVHAAVLDSELGRKDLQQCADAVMRLRAEYLYRSGQEDAIAFDFTSGFRAEWVRWRRGERIRVTGNRCAWVHGAAPDSSHAQLMRYLDAVFTYAGTLSLARELKRASPAPPDAGDLRIGDVFIQGGSPGHAVLVVDAARHADGRLAFLLAQGYMPAQEIHVLRNARQPDLGAWYLLHGEARLHTPEWTFDWSHRRRWP